MMDEKVNRVCMTSPEGVKTFWTREAWDRMQCAMRDNDRELATALYLAGEPE